MKENFFAYISRMRYIGRWSLMRNSLPENHHHLRFYRVADVPPNVTSVPGSMLQQMMCSNKQKTVMGCTGLTTCLSSRNIQPHRTIKCS